MTADRLVRWTAVAAVLAVAAVAALISYRHAVDVVTAHGEAGILAYLYPVVIDGLIVAASMVLLDAARHREDAPALAWWMLAAGIAATLAVNVLAGVVAGPLGAVIASWPALAFVGCYELVMMLVRATAKRTTATPELDASPAAAVVDERQGDEPEADEPEADEPAPEPAVEVPAIEVAAPVAVHTFVTPPKDAEDAALIAYRAAFLAMSPLSLNQLMTRFGLTRAAAKRVRETVLAEASDGQGGEAAVPAGEGLRRMRAREESGRADVQGDEPEPDLVTA